jgi:glycosyltransferase involved in cell wall biosynthesis
MSPTPPVFSIVIPTYNRAHLIGKTIGSILKQEFQQYEVLVIDDGSTDNTEEVVKQFSATSTHIQYIRKTNGERGAARNYGARLSKGSYINFFDSDDLMLGNHLTTAVVMMQTQPEFFHLGYDHRLEDGTLLGKQTDMGEDLQHTILFDNKLSCNGVFIRKDIAIQFPFEEDRVLASSEDWHLWIRLICRFDLPCSKEITSTVVNHDYRSLKTIATDKLVARDLLLIDLLRKDDVVSKVYGKSFNRFVAERFTFFMLRFSEQRIGNEVFRWARRAAAVYLPIIFSKRFIASIKNSIL